MWTELATAAGFAAALAASCALSLLLVRVCIAQLIRAVAATHTAAPQPHAGRASEVPALARAMRHRPAA